MSDRPAARGSLATRLGGWLFRIRTTDRFALTKARLLVGILLVLAGMNVVFTFAVFLDTLHPAIVGTLLALVQATYFAAIALTRAGKVDLAAMLTAVVLTLVQFAVPLLLDGARAHLVFLILPMLVTAFTAGPRTTWALCAIQVGGLVAIGALVPHEIATERLPGTFLLSIGMMLVLLAATSSVMQSLQLALTRSLEHSGRRERELRIRAEAASRTKNQFLAAMSHELRTPLNVIIGYAELLDETLEAGQTLDPEDLETIERIHAAGRHLLVLITNVLDISRIEAGRMSMQVETFDAADLAEEVVAMLAPLAHEQQDELALEVDRRPLAISTDRTKLRQVLFNLLENALKFTHQGRVVLQVESRGGLLALSVVDTGCGIEPGLVDQVFETFVQGPGSTTRRRGGTGLGLALCKRFVEMMEGEIHVASTPGQGTTVRVHLPVDLAVGETSHFGLEPVGVVS